MARDLGEKSRFLLDTLSGADEPLTLAALAEAAGDVEDGAEARVAALLRNLKGRGLVHQPGRGTWAAGPAPEAPLEPIFPAGALALPPDEPSRAPRRRQPRADKGRARPRKPQGVAHLGVIDSTGRTHVIGEPFEVSAPPERPVRLAVGDDGTVLVIEAGAVILAVPAEVARSIATLIQRVSA
jgi:hypothetical protein